MSSGEWRLFCLGHNAKSHTLMPCNYANPLYGVDTDYADYAGGIRVSFIQPRLF